MDGGIGIVAEDGLEGEGIGGGGGGSAGVRV